MKVLLDECVPRKLRRELAEHEVLTGTEHGWSGVKNGELLALAAAEFDVFLTVDQNLKYQQNLQAFNLKFPVSLLRGRRIEKMGVQRERCSLWSRAGLIPRLRSKACGALATPPKIYYRNYSLGRAQQSAENVVAIAA